jgi:hypothetical protein
MALLFGVFLQSTIVNVFSLVSWMANSSSATGFSFEGWLIRQDKEIGRRMKAGEWWGWVKESEWHSSAFILLPSKFT